jgi:hypothetical protein
MLRLAVLYAVVIVVYSALAALFTQLTVVTYENALIPGLVLYLVMGVYAGTQLRSRRALVSVAVPALVQPTAGWFVASLLYPSFSYGWTFSIVVMAIAWCLLGFGVGAAGVWMGLGAAGSRRELL